jgi:hypothetical protein
MGNPTGWGTALPIGGREAGGTGAPIDASGTGLE